MEDDFNENVPHIVLVGGGIMSATLGVLLKHLDPRLTIDIFERLDNLAAESSDAWNNAGTGHSAFCELNYTPAGNDGCIDAAKAIEIAEKFEVSRQFWAWLADTGVLPDPSAFIRRVPHVSFVWGEDGVAYLKERFRVLSAHPLFADMKYSEAPDVLRQWMPLVMEGRDPSQCVAATYVEHGTDVDFGVLARALFAHLDSLEGVSVHTHHEVRNIFRDGQAPWVVRVHDRVYDVSREVAANCVFIGAGGGALPLLEHCGIPEASGYGGFPVSGLWLKCVNPKVISAHHAKVYGRAAIGAPPMSVPHLDSRVIRGEKALLFGPFAGFSTKFLKEGSYLDLPLSIGLDNLLPMISAGLHNLTLTQYLVKQVFESEEERLHELHDYYPNARLEDWELSVAGQRVQVIRKDDKEGGILCFGTEVVTAHDGTLATLLGASPGASTSVSILLEILHRCFAFEMSVDHWSERLLEMIPGYGQHLNENPALLKQTRARTARALRLH